MVEQSRKNYLGLKSSLSEFFREPVRYLKSSNQKESQFEKPYRTADYPKMHLKLPQIDWTRKRVKVPPKIYPLFGESRENFGEIVYSYPWVRATIMTSGDLELGETYELSVRAWFGATPISIRAEYTWIAYVSDGAGTIPMVKGRLDEYMYLTVAAGFEGESLEIQVVVFVDEPVAHHEIYSPDGSLYYKNFYSQPFLANMIRANVAQGGPAKYIYISFRISGSYYVTIWDYVNNVAPTTIPADSGGYASFPVIESELDNWKATQTLDYELAGGAGTAQSSYVPTCSVSGADTACMVVNGTEQYCGYGSCEATNPNTYDSSLIDVYSWQDTRTAPSDETPAHYEGEEWVPDGPPPDGVWNVAGDTHRKVYSIYQLKNVYTGSALHSWGTYAGRVRRVEEYDYDVTYIKIYPTIYPSVLSGTISEWYYSPWGKMTELVVNRATDSSAAFDVYSRTAVGGYAGACSFFFSYGGISHSTAGSAIGGHATFDTGVGDPYNKVLNTSLTAALNSLLTTVASGDNPSYSSNFIIRLYHPTT